MNFKARVVTCYMSRKRGIPLSRMMFPFLDGSTFSDDLDLGVGIFGTTVSGEIISRLGIYQFRDMDLEFRYAINLNPETGSPVSKYRIRDVAGYLEKRPLLESDRAMMNWVTPLLLNSRFAEGSYRWSEDPFVAMDWLDPDDRRRLEGIAGQIPERSFFASERTFRSAQEMVEQHLSHESADNKLVPPSLCPLIASSTPDDEIPEAARNGVQRLVIPLKQFRAMAAYRFTWGLRSADGAARDIRLGFVTALNTIDRMMSSTGTNYQILDSIVMRASDSLLCAAQEHLKSQNLEPDVLRKHARVLECGIRCLQEYKNGRTHNTKGGIAVLGIKNSASRIEKKLLMAGPFASPMTAAVWPLKMVQVIDKIETDGSFPEKGEDLFK